VKRKNQEAKKQEMSNGEASGGSLFPDFSEKFPRSDYGADYTEGSAPLASCP
jgi:hypothetical protein